MKIAVFHNLPGGGSVRVLSEHVEYLKSKGHDVEVFSICDKENTWVDKIFTHEQKEIFVCPPENFILRMLWIIFTLPTYHEKLAGQLNKDGYELLYVHHDKYTKSPYLLKYSKIPTLYFLHEPPREFYEPLRYFCEKPIHYLINFLRFPIKLIDRNNVKATDIIITNSKYSKGVVKKVYGRESVVCYPPITGKHKIDSLKKKQFLYIGGINKLKDPFFAFNTVKPFLNNYKMIVVGDGSKEYLKKFKRITANSNIEIITKHVTDKKLRKLYSDSIILLAPFQNEPYGLVSLEAQSFGCVPIVSDSGGLKETIKNGFTGIVTKKNEHDFNKAIREVINKNNYYQRHSSNWLKRFTPSKSFSILEKYENLLSKRRVS